MARTILIGDPHGCAEELQELLDKCEATPEDWVILLGDLLDRGPNSGGCVDIAMRLEARQGKRACVLGNHEDTHLRYEKEFRVKGKLPSMPPHHAAARDQLRPDHWQYLFQLPTFLRIPEHNAVAVHAGLFPGRSIEEQSHRHLLHGQMLRPALHEKTCWPSRVPDNERGLWSFWTDFWKGPERAFFGHSVLTKPLITPKAVGLDGGCCFGLSLWAYVLPDERLVEVKSRVKAGDRSDRRVTMITDEVGTY